MPILSHTVFRDDPTLHISWLDYKPRCVVETRTLGGRRNWTWRVSFRDPDADGVVEVLSVSGTHLVRPHAGESAPNQVGVVAHLEPCRRKQWPPIVALRPHGSHEDRMITQIRRVSGSTLIRLFIVLQHCKASSRFDVPDIPLEDGGSLAKLVRIQFAP